MDNNVYILPKTVFYVNDTVIIMIICTVIYIVIFEVLLVIWILIRYNKNVCEGNFISYNNVL